MFKPAKTVSAYKKLAVFGGPGSGKTVLTLAAPGKKMVIDTESGTIPYASLTEFDIIHTQDFGEIKNAIDELSSNPPKEESALIIDSTSIIWAGLQQAMLEKKLGEKGIKVSQGTEKVVLNQADWGILKKWNNDIFNTLMSLKCHVVCTFRETELREEDGFKGTGVFNPQWEKNTPYVFDFVGRINDRKFTFRKGRLAREGRLVDLMGKSVDIPNIEKGSDLPLLWEALFGKELDKPVAAHVVSKSTNVNFLNNDPESLKLSRELRSVILPKYEIKNEDIELYLLNKTLKDGVTPVCSKGEDGKVHLSEISAEILRWLIQVVETDASREKLKVRIEELKKNEIPMGKVLSMETAGVK